MNRLLRAMALLTLAASLGACSSLNPFASEPKNKPAELTAITPTAELTSVWRVGIGSSGDYVLTPAVIGASVYAASADGTLARFDDGVQAWRIDVGQPISGGVGSNGKLVVVGTAKGEVLAFDAATGKEVWKSRVSSEVLAAPALSEALVTVRSGDARIFALDPADGKRRWVYQRSAGPLSLRTQVGAVLAGRALLTGFSGGKLVAVSTVNGAALWEVTVAQPKGATELERVADIASLPAYYGNTVCAAAYQGRVACFEMGSGNPLWSRDVSSSAGLDVDQKGVYVSDEKGAVQAYERSNGASLWKQDKLFMRNLSKPLAVGPYIAVGDYQGVVHLLRRDDGSFVARFSTDGSGVSADPQPYKDGFLIQTRAGGLYALTVK